LLSSSDRSSIELAVPSDRTLPLSASCMDGADIQRATGKKFNRAGYVLSLSLRKRQRPFATDACQGSRHACAPA
jgi:hypothetical protein